MAKIHGLLDMGRRGMAVNQSALNTTSHNISNKSVEGYSRQRAEVMTSPAVDEGRFRVGTGSQLGAINRINNPWIEKQLEREGSNLAFMEGRSGALQRLESVFNEQSVKGLNNTMTEFFNGFRELANNPESLATRTAVRDNAHALVNNLKEMDRQIGTVTSELNSVIVSSVRDVNAHVKEISRLNEKIQSTELGGLAANDERDRRDLLLKKLSEKLDITYAEDPKSGMINITAGKTAVLVGGAAYTELKAVTNRDNQTQVMLETSSGGTQSDITDQFKRGTIGGAIDLRDGMVAGIREDLAELTYTLASEVNNAHTEGFDRYSQQGLNFFVLPTEGNFEVKELKLNEAISKDVGRIAAASKPNAPGDNTTANVIHSLQFQNMMGPDRTFTFDNFYNAKVAEVGLMNQKSVAGIESQKNIVDQMKNIRESVSGVSLDEEAQKMIEFQKAYEASARVIRMADEMFETVLNLKRL